MEKSKKIGDRRTVIAIAPVRTCQGIASPIAGSALRHFIDYLWTGVEVSGWTQSLEASGSQTHGRTGSQARPTGCSGGRLADIYPI